MTHMLKNKNKELKNPYNKNDLQILKENHGKLFDFLYYFKFPYACTHHMVY